MAHHDGARYFSWRAHMASDSPKKCLVRKLGFVCLVSAAFACVVPVGHATQRDRDRSDSTQKKQDKNDKKQTKPPKKLTEQARLAAIRKAQIWAATDVPAMDLRAGPQGRGAFQPNEEVACDYVERKDLPGTSLKFYCDLGDGDVVKVRYGQDNGKIVGEVLATRLLWALGFGADHVYPVRLTCRGCSPDPWHHRARVPGAVQVFDPADIERKPKGKELETAKKSGWEWPELNLIDEGAGGAPQVQRDALKLLAVFMQLTDTKEEQQRLLCLPGGETPEGDCDKPFMMLHDVGLSFGHANYFNRSGTGSVNYELWSKTPMWRDRASCRGHASQSATGTLEDDPKIGEAGRKFLADLLVQLSDRQLRDLFEVARVNLRSRTPHSSEPAASVDEWIAAFKHRRDEIVNARCPS
jgi:hypothetical protein